MASMTDATSVWFTVSDGSYLYSSSESVVKTSLSYKVSHARRQNTNAYGTGSSAQFEFCLTTLLDHFRSF